MNELLLSPRLSGNASAPQPPLVLHVRASHTFGGGPEKTILSSPRFLKRLGYDALCAYLLPQSDIGAFQKRAKQEGAPLAAFADDGPLDIKLVPQLIRLCREKKVAVWHGHDYKSNLLGLLVRQFHRMKLLTTVHGWGCHHTLRLKIYNYVDRLCLKQFDDVICVSEDQRDECLRWGVAAERCHLIHNAIDTDVFRRSCQPGPARAAFGPAPQGLLLGAMGRLADEKAFDLLIRAVDRLLLQGADISLWIAGEGAERPRLEHLINELGRGDRIRLLGHIADPKPFFEALDVFVLSSLREGLPNVVLEAMALEVPVVATHIAGVPNVLDDGRAGILVESGSVDALCEGLLSLISRSDLRDVLREAGRQRVEEHYGFEQRMRRIAAIYDRALGSAADAAAPTAGAVA